MGSTEEDPAKLIVKKEGGDGGCLDTELVKEVKPDDPPLAALLVTDSVEQMACEPPETQMENDFEVDSVNGCPVGAELVEEGVNEGRVVGIGKKPDKVGGVGEESVPCGHPSLMVDEAPVCDLQQEYSEEVIQEMQLVRSVEETYMKEVGHQLVTEDHSNGLPPAREAAGVNEGGMELAAESVEVSELENNMDGEMLKEDLLGISCEGDDEDRLRTMGEAATARDGGGLVVPVMPEMTLMEIIADEVPPKEDIAADMDDDDDGPPPGWEAGDKDEGKTVPDELLSVTCLEEASPRVEQSPSAGEDVDEDGPPPGWEAAFTKDAGVILSLSSVKTNPLEIEMEEARPTEVGNGDDDGPPPGWEARTIECGEAGEAIVKQELSILPPANPSKIKVEELWPTEIENDNTGPLPGWEAATTKDGLAGEAVAKQESSILPFASVEINPLEIKVEEAQPTEVKNDIHGPSRGWEGATNTDGGVGEAVDKQESRKLEKGKQKEELRPPGRESVAAPRPPLPSKAQSPTTERGQVVCGSCRSLLSYSQGAKYVQCSCCQTVSFVLEAHQVGQVYCGRCSVLLMYFYGSPAVRCSSCQFITQIGPHNIRPPLSERVGTLQSQLAQLCPKTNLAR